MPNHSKACLYLRYSTRPKHKSIDPGETLQVQESYCRKYFEFQGIEIGKVISDPQTSARLVPLAKRKGGCELMELTTGREPEYTIVGAYRLDRLFRDLVDGTMTLRAWDRANVALHLAAQGGQSLNTTTATGRYIVSILLATAAHEADLTAERTRHADARHMMNGRIVGGLPYGWRRDPQDGSKMLPDIEEQCTLAEIIRLAGGNAIQAKPRKLAQLLNELGYTNRKGTPWHHETVRRILKKPRFAFGVLEHKDRHPQSEQNKQ